ncbi:Uncharacterised protein [Bordetella pertussis]|nr:Uncharacterised protein [Bordetella pertussis]CFW29880.1 Uncharacterised protein [Bordetella pertussis]
MSKRCTTTLPSSQSRKVGRYLAESAMAST